MVKNWYPLVNLYKKLWKITSFNGKSHYEWPCSIAFCIPEGKRPVKTMENHGKSPSLISVNQGTNCAMASIALLN